LDFALVGKGEDPQAVLRVSKDGADVRIAQKIEGEAAEPYKKLVQLIRNEVYDSKGELLNKDHDFIKLHGYVPKKQFQSESLSHFLHTKTHGFIGSPYREDFDLRISIDHSDDKRLYAIEQKIRYKCRKAGESIQDKVQWLMQREDELDRIEEFKVTVEIPNNVFQSLEFKKRYPKISEARTTLDAKDKDNRLTSLEMGLGYCLALDEFKAIDGLFIEIFAKYHVSANRNIACLMGYPTKGLRITIRYTNDLRVDTAIFGVDQRDCHREHDEGFYTLSYDSWMLPTTVVVSHLWEPKPLLAEEAARPAIANS